MTPRWNVSVFGAGGYLGGRLVLTRDQTIDFTAMGRYAKIGSGADGVIDLGFPQKRQSRTSDLQYLALVESRAEVCRLRGIPYVYGGSYSSRPGSPSRYGRLKYEAERLVADRGGLIVPMGLVINHQSPGGRYAELASIVDRLPVVPLPHSAYFSVYCTDEQDALRALIEAVKTGRVRSPLAHEVSLQEILLDVSVSCGKRSVHIPRGLTRLASALVRHARVGKLDNLASLT